jgi:branched-chain amino acid transport system ATP-binding protein
MIEISDLHVNYGRVHALSSVSIKLRPGEIFAVLGANGAGKTSILKTISGVLDPVKGTVEFEGRKIRSMEPDKVVRLGISHVPEGREVFPFLSVRDNLRMGAYIRKDSKTVASDLEKVFDYFPVLRERQNQIAGQLSGGQQQMLAISRALMSRPKVLLLDEPSLGLSPLLVKEIFTIIRRLNAEEGVSILLVEQNAKMALETAHYGYVLEVGRVVMHDTCANLLQSDQVREFYLGMHSESGHGGR